MTYPTEQAPSLPDVTRDIIDMITAEMPLPNLTAESSLLDGGLDSLRVMSLVLRIENRWDIDLDADDADELRTIMREPYFIPSGTAVFSQLQQFQASGDRLGFVVDEYGELQGLLTVEDILEEIAGEFTTQSPLRQGAFAPQAEWLADELCRLHVGRRFAP